MSPGTGHITLGGVRHALSAVTIGKLEALQAALVGEYASPIARSVAVLNTLLVKPIDDSTPARLDEVNQAVRELVKHAGYKEAEPGNGAAPEATTGA